MIRIRVTPERVRVGRVVDVGLTLELSTALRPGARIRFFCDIRQDASRPQCEDKKAPGYVEVDGGPEVVVSALDVRTLDLYPKVPEFLSMVRIDLPSETRAGDLRLTIKRWSAPARPIDPFRFWVLVDGEGAWDFVPVGYKTYHQFIETESGERADTQALRTRLVVGEISVRGQYPRPPRHVRRAPLGGWQRPFWGDLHGMAFNQRPLDDFYHYARRVTRLDFCAAVLFSYNTCVGDTWSRVVDAAERNTRPGRFVALAAFECGTPPDDSHRVAYFPDPSGVPPIFCESRPPALDPVLQARFHPDTVMCKDPEALYDSVESHGGFVGGHFHTLSYRREVLTEMWQKQEFSLHHQEENIYELLRSGHRLGLTGSSDTHDSMPGNPYPEPGCPRPSGLTGVWADALHPRALADALTARRCFATTGARIIMRLDYGEQTMGEACEHSYRHRFHISVRGTARLYSVEVLEDGRPVQTWLAHNRDFDYSWAPKHREESHWYVVRVRQVDGHQGWTSPIWLTAPR